MSSEAALLSLSTTISGLQSQIDELKQDKGDLRSDKEVLKAEVADLKEQCKGAVAEVAKLKEELQIAICAAEDWKKRHEVATTAPKTPGQASHELTPAQTNNDPRTPIVNNILPEDSPRTSATAAPPAPRARKRKASAVEETGDTSASAQKRSSRTLRNRGSQSQERAPATALTSAGAPKEASTSSRPEVQYNEDVAFVLPPHILQHYLDLTPPLAISPAPSDLHVSREFLANTYGGCAQQSAQHVGAFENPTEDSDRAFTFPPFDLNPGMPLVPGHGGVIIASKYDRKTGHPWGLFRKDLTGTTETWVYMGEYEWTAMGKMSAETFRRQNDKVKQNWADKLLGWKMGLGEYYPAMRARIALRKAGVLPVPNIHSHDTLVKEELKRMRSQVGHPVDRDDIISAFERGEEALDVTLLRCVAYDRSLAMDIEKKFASPPPRVKRAKKRGSGYRYPVSFQSPAARSHKPSAKKRRAMPSTQTAEAFNLSLASMPTTSTGAQASLGATTSPCTSVPTMNKAIDGNQPLQQGISSVYNSAVSREDQDDGLSFVSENELDELLYP